MSAEEIGQLVQPLGDIVGVLAEAEPAGKAEVYSRLGLRLTYKPGEQESNRGGAAVGDHVRNEVSGGRPCPQLHDRLSRRPAPTLTRRCLANRAIESQRIACLR
jgi:hypothetical protein